MVILLFLLVGWSHFGTTTATPNIENELAKISSTCLSSRDHELLSGDFVKQGLARKLSYYLLTQSPFSIGLTELRRALDFGEQQAWRSCNTREPGEKELEKAYAKSAKDYYDLKEPLSFTLCLDSDYFFEKTIAIAIDYLDKRIPSIREIFRRRFEEIDKKSIDRKAIDYWIKEMLQIYVKIDEKISNLDLNDRECWDSVKDV